MRCHAPTERTTTRIPTTHAQLSLTPMKQALQAAVLLGLASAASAQSFTFDAIQSQSNYTFSGDTSLGPIVGSPNNQFQLAGTMEFALDSGGNPVGGGQWLSADLLVTPDLAGFIPNPLPFLPPLATLTLTGMRFSTSGDPFTCDSAGNWQVNTVLTITSGTLTVTPLTGSQTVTDLTGTVGPVSLTDGTVTGANGTYDMVIPMVTSFDFTDPTSGISATLGLQGTLTGRYVNPAPTNYCVVNPNSVGSGAVISSTGTSSIAANNFALVSTGNPAGKPGIFFFGNNAVSNPLGNGTLCAAGGIRRFAPTISNSSGVFNRTVDLTNLPGGAVFTAGQTKRFQQWYRDPAAGNAGFNLSDALAVVFCP